jgi:peptidyl-prolyl cis-trans isomerase B (cyclophilin B)
MSKKISILFLIIFLAVAVSACAQKETNVMPANQTPPAGNAVNADSGNSPNATSGPAHLGQDNSASSTASSTPRALPGQDDLYRQYKSVLMKTNFGDIEIQLFGDDAPLTVNNFLNLAKSGFYNDTKFHRVIKGFMIQGGDPNTKGADSDWSRDGQGGPGYQFVDELNNHKLVRGTLAMANSGPNTNGSQFFIVTMDLFTPGTGQYYTPFGQVISGMEAVNKIEDLDTNENDHPLKNATIESIELK